MTEAVPITDDELSALFAGLERTPLALAVSGGADSMALMHMVARWAARDDVRTAYAGWWAFKVRQLRPHVLSPSAALVPELPPEEQAARRAAVAAHVIVLTVDHGLRPEAAEEAAFVAHEAARLGLPCQVLRWEGEKPATGIQNAAREARRALLVETIHQDAAQLEARMLENGVKVRRAARSLVMAHQMEDQAETVMMRLARGSGLDGLIGMRSRGTLTSGPAPSQPAQLAVPVARPLLGVSKARLVATLNAYGCKWVDDPSNDDDRFERVRIRQVLQQLEPLGFTAERIALSAQRLGDAEFDLRMVLFGELADRHPVVWWHGLMAEFEQNGPFFCGAYVQVRSMRQVFASIGGASRRPELAEIEALVRKIASSDVAGFTLGGCKIELHREQPRTLRVFREGSGEGLPVVTILPGQAVDWDGARFTIEAGEGIAASAEVRALGMAGWADLKRKVPELADLKWPAAAAATLPVIARDGANVAHPVIDHLLRTAEALPARPRAAWERYAVTLEPGFKASFNVVPW